MKKLLITGSTGFIGVALIKSLLINSKDYEIYCAVRETSNRSKLEKLDVNFVNFDLLNESTFRPALMGMDIILHLAADFNFHSTLDSLRKHNVDASEKLASIAISEKISRFIYCSSTEAIGVVDNGNEESEYNPFDDYGISKMEAEIRLIEMMNSENLPLTIIRPTGVYGPAKCYPFSDIIESVKAGVVFAYPGSGMSNIHFSYIDDIVQGIIRVLENKEKSLGEIFILAGDEPQTYKEMFETICKYLDKSPPRLHFPIFISKIGMKLLSILFKLRGKDYYILRPRGVENSIVSRSYSNSKAKKLLGFSPETDFDTGVKNTIEWLKMNDFI